MAASLMHRGQERHERIGLRVATFLKRCGRDPETGSMLTSSGQRQEDVWPEHLAALRAHKVRQRRQHQWTPCLPRLSDNGTRDASEWHRMLQDEDAADVAAEANAALSAARERAGTADTTSLHPAAFYLPPTTRTNKDGSPRPVSSAEMSEAMELSELYLSKDTTRHVSQRHLVEDNRRHLVKISQQVRSSDGLDKVTSGVPPEKRLTVKAGRVDIVVPGETPQDPHRVVSRLVSHKQFLREKLSHSVGIVARYEKESKQHGGMNPRRLQILGEAFSMVAGGSSTEGVIRFEEMKRRYQSGLSRHPDVLSRSKTEDAVMREFLSQWDRNGDAEISFDEFVAYYDKLCREVEIAEDDYFELLVRNAWHLSGGEGWCENTSNKRVLVLYHSGQSEVVELINDLGLDYDDVQAVLAHLQKQGFDLSEIRSIDTTGQV